MARFVMAEIKCACGKYVNVRLKEVNKGDSRTVNCWNCKRPIMLKGNLGYCDGKPAKTTIVVNEESKDGG